MDEYFSIIQKFPGKKGKSKVRKWASELCKESLSLDEIQQLSSSEIHNAVTKRVKTDILQALASDETLLEKMLSTMGKNRKGRGNLGEIMRRAHLEEEGIPKFPDKYWKEVISPFLKKILQPGSKEIALTRNRMKGSPKKIVCDWCKQKGYLHSSYSNWFPVEEVPLKICENMSSEEKEALPSFTRRTTGGIRKLSFCSDACRLGFHWANDYETPNFPEHLQSELDKVLKNQS